MNLDKDLEDIQSTTRRVGWSEVEKTARLWKQLEGDEGRRGFHTTAREPKRAHLRVPCFKNSTKFHERE